MWEAVITAITLAILGFLWTQSRKLDTIHQALFGVNGRNGILRNVTILNEEARTVDQRITNSRHDLSNRVQIEIGEMHLDLLKRLDEIKADIRLLQVRKR